ncbi:hypothetical protein ACFL6C_10660 [Myxococcota bacterium]
MTANLAPEQKSHIKIGCQPKQSGGEIQNPVEMNIFAAQGAAVREVKRKKGHGQVDHLLLIDGKAVGVLNAKKTVIGHWKVWKLQRCAEDMCGHHSFRSRDVELTRRRRSGGDTLEGWCRRPY